VTFMIAKQNQPHSSPGPDKIRSLLDSQQVVLIPSSGSVSLNDLRSHPALSNGNLIACDFHVTDIERGEPLPFGYLKNSVTAIDHHAPTPVMMKHISSTNLAIQFVNERGVVGNDTRVVINHCDCDSVLATLILKGIIPPDESLFGRAAIAADHTGEINDIADLLQSLEGKRDLEFSGRNLLNLINGRTLEPEAERLLEKRYENRRHAMRFVENGSFQSAGEGFMWALLNKKIDSCLLPASLPEGVTLIMTANPIPDAPEKTQVRLRLGLSAPAGFSLNDLEIRKLDPAFGGRWNAGSNARGGGTEIPPETYALEVAKRLREALPTS